MRFALALCSGLAAAAPCWAKADAVQVGNEAKFGRIVIALSGPGYGRIAQHGSQLDIIAPATEEIETPDQVPRNVLSMQGGRAKATLMLAPGARAAAKQEGRNFVVFVFDPPARGRDAGLTADLRPNPAKPAPPVAVVSTPVPQPSAPGGGEKAAVAAPSSPPVQNAPAAAPAAASATEAPPAPATPKADPAPAEPPRAPAPVVRSFTVRATDTTGVAAFRRGRKGVVVFDEAVNLSDPDAPSTITPSLQAIQGGTLASVPLADDESLALTRSENGLTVAIAPATGSPAPAVAIPNGIRFQIANPGRVMAISDPVSGQTMLIGTTRKMSGEGATVGVGRSAPGYVLLPTWLGLALDATSDEIDLNVSLAGYTLSIADKAAANATAPARVENQFAIPTSPAPALIRELTAQVASAAGEPVRARGPDRVAAARSMLALGMSAEAEALLNLAANDDPAVARDPATAALTGIAAILAGRPAEATGLDNPALPSGGDIALWRGLRDVAEGKPAPALAGAWPLLSAYPEAIRSQIAPTVLEAAAKNGADVPAADMTGPTLAIARAYKLAHDGKNEEAIAALTEVKDGRDERDSVRAAIALAELRFRLGQASAAETADQLDRQTIRWRGGLKEYNLRLRVAVLRSQAGQWRSALEGLRDAQAVFVDRKAELAAAQSDVFRSLLAADGSKIPPLELVLIAGEFADAMPTGDDGDRLAGLLAEKLAALDLPTRAIPVLKKLVEKAQTPTAQAEYGLRLAQMQLDAGQAVAADALLSSLDLSGLPPAREEQRTLLLARAKAAQNDFAGAAAALLTVSTPQADDLRATYYARAGDWQRSLETLEGMAASSVPETGDLTEQQQELVLREATAAVQAGDNESLRKLAKFEKRITPPRADLFRVLTANAIRGPEDLPRAARELALSKSLPDRLNALKLR